MPPALPRRPQASPHRCQAADPAAPHKKHQRQQNDHHNRLMGRVSVAGQERVPLRRRGKQLAGRHRHWHTAVLIVVLLARAIFTIHLLASSLARIPHLPSQRRVIPFTSFMSDLDDTLAESVHTQEEQGLGQLDDSWWGFVAVDFGPIRSGVAVQQAYRSCSLFLNCHRNDSHFLRALRMNCGSSKNLNSRTCTKRTSLSRSHQ